MGKLHTLLASQVCMCGNPSLPPRRPSTLRANRASELAAYDLARQQCEGDEMSQQLRRASPGCGRKGKITVFCQSENLFAWLVAGARHKQRLCKTDWTDESKAAWRRGPRPARRRPAPPSPHVSRPSGRMHSIPEQRPIRSREEAQPLAGSERPLPAQSLGWCMSCSGTYCDVF